MDCFPSLKAHNSSTLGPAIESAQRLLVLQEAVSTAGDPHPSRQLQTDADDKESDSAAPPSYQAAIGSKAANGK